MRKSGKYESLREKTKGKFSNPKTNKLNAQVYNLSRNVIFKSLNCSDNEISMIFIKTK